MRESLPLSVIPTEYIFSGNPDVVGMHQEVDVWGVLESAAELIALDSRG